DRGVIGPRAVCWGLDAGDRVLADPETLGHRTRRPLRRAVFGDLMQGVVDHRFDRAWREPPLAPTSLGDLADPVDSLIREALPPTPDSIGVDVTAAGD